MRRSPLAHPLAVLRTTIGLTQKELGVLVNRAARTIQAVELRNLPLSEDLAMLIAHATGVDAGWLLEGDPSVPPRKGTTALGMATGTGEYGRAEFEFHRAFIEAPKASQEEIEAACQSAIDAAAAGPSLVTVSLPVMKTAVLANKARLTQAADQAMLQNLKAILDHTITAESGDLIRWKIRQLLHLLAKEYKLPIAAPDAPVPAPLHVLVADSQDDKPAASRTRKPRAKVRKAKATRLKSL